MVDFLYLGPPKSGSTWVYSVLSAQKGVYIPKAKDIYYFDRYYVNGDGWYDKFFEGSGDAVLKGEICHDYIYSSEAIGRIYNHNPEVKFIAILRHPVDRAISHYKYSLRVGNVKGSLKEACSKNPNIIESGFLSEYYAGYLSKFRRNQLLVVDFSMLKKRPRHVVSKFSEFLNVEIDIKNIDFSQRVNESSMSRWPVLTKVLRTAGRKVRDMGFANLVGQIKNGPVMKLLYTKKQSDVSIGQDDLAWLNRIYADEVRRMKEIFPRELEDW